MYLFMVILCFRLANRLNNIAFVYLLSAFSHAKLANKLTGYKRTRNVFFLYYRIMSCLLWI